MDCGEFKNSLNMLKASELCILMTEIYSMCIVASWSHEKNEREHKIEKETETEWTYNGFWIIFMLFSQVSQPFHAPESNFPTTSFSFQDYFQLY